MNEYTCKRCGKQFENYHALRKHVGRIHKIHSTEFYVEFHLNGVWPLCGCGCGQKVKWNSKDRKFRDLIHGHYSRIHNNWGHNKKAIEASANTRRNQFASGTRTVWNVGLDITDPRVRKNSIRTKITINASPEEIARRSELMKSQWCDGTIVPLSGSAHPNWQGGVSSINQLARADRTLYTEWKLPILQRDGFKCTVCGNATELHVHHDAESFAEIIKKVMTIDDYEHIDDFDRKRQVADKVVQYHVSRKVSGKTMCAGCHNKLHPSLNFL